jgi:hypothetical protein
VKWRIGSQVPLNVYDGDRPVCQCHNEQDAILIVNAINAGKVSAETEEGRMNVEGR